MPPRTGEQLPTELAALVCIMLDLLLVSETFGLGWFKWVSAWEQKTITRQEEEN